MTATKLFIQRLYVVTRNGEIAYDEQFHKGVNIIRGENSSGKSTITHLLFYGLGGTYLNFVPQAKKCQYIYVEINISNCELTLKREIKLADNDRVESMAGMRIFWGNLEDALSNACKSYFFGYNSTDKSKSFSNALFELLGIPIAIGDNNITMHQLLRLMYVDQESPTGSLFMYEMFDNQITRETVAELLMGLYDSDLYSAKLELRELEKRLFDTNVEVKAVKAALPRAEECSSGYISEIIDNKEKEIQKLSKTIQEKRAGRITNLPKYNYIKDFSEKVKLLRQKVSDMQETIDTNKMEIEDTKLFILALNKRKTALNNSIKVRTCLENYVLEFCPECLTKLEEQEDINHCRLCKAPIDNSRGIRQAKRYELEISFQIKESELILKQTEQELLKNEASLTGIKKQLSNYEKLLKAELQEIRSPQDEEIDNMIYNKGLLEGELLQYRTMLEKAIYYESLLNKKKEFETKIGETKRFISAKQSQKEKNKKTVENKIKEMGIYLLKHDLDRQQEFTNANDFIVDFSNNIVYLSNKYAKYSASSNFYLKIVARFAIFLSSLELPIMRYPHFIFADNMEDKGIEEKRAQNFQQVLIDKVNQYPSDDYQVIYTTSYITEDLNNSSYVVGDKYTNENKSLKNV